MPEKTAPYLKVRPDGKTYLRQEPVPYEQTLGETYQADIIMAGIEAVAW